MRSCRTLVAVLVLVGVAAPRLLATPSTLQSALDLYAAASYEEALVALDTVSTAGLSVDEQVVVAQHRMLCLMAVGRTADADRAAASLLALRPEFVLGAHDASPRVRAMFDTARRRVLPTVVRERFAAGRRLYDSGALAEARPIFSSVTAALGDAGLIERDPALADLRTLADGFLALTTAAVPRVESAAAPVSSPAATVPAPLPTEAERTAALSPAAAAVTVPATSPAPVVPGAPSTPTLIVDESSALVSFPSDSAVAWREGESPAERDEQAPALVAVPVSTVAAPLVASEAPAPEVAAPVPAAPGAAAPATSAPVALTPAAPAPAPESPAPAAATPVPPTAAPAGAPFTPIDIFTYDWRDKDVTPPVPVAQAVSGWWGGMGEPPAGTPLGAVEVVIDEHGKVAEAKIYLSVNRVYDAVLLGSVGQWRYQPATRGGRPVKYRRISGVVSGR